MSMHKIPLTEFEEAGLRLHRLPVGTPSQLSDCFRIGIKYGQLAVTNEIAELKRQLEDVKDECDERGIDIDILVKLNETLHHKLAESQAREARLLKFIGEVAKQTPEKPDYWSSCSQCERNSREAEDYMELPHDDTALREYLATKKEKSNV